MLSRCCGCFYFLYSIRECGKASSDLENVAVCAQCTVMLISVHISPLPGFVCFSLSLVWLNSVAVRKHQTLASYRQAFRSVCRACFLVTLCVKIHKVEHVAHCNDKLKLEMRVYHDQKNLKAFAWNFLSYAAFSPILVIRTKGAMVWAVMPEYLPVSSCAGWSDSVRTYLYVHVLVCVWMGGFKMKRTIKCENDVSSVSYLLVVLLFSLTVLLSSRRSDLTTHTFTLACIHCTETKSTVKHQKEILSVDVRFFYRIGLLFKRCYRFFCVSDFIR